ncbi:MULTISPECIES: HD domain-containing protein [unclassified Listeria]|uniref:HD domain-containing protein n=1 Tax=unclassified Listeria TaxID=2642072 RepID=UPI000B5914B2|nr:MULTISPECIES: HD domain-containing protein [unclassified Listeria]
MNIIEAAKHWMQEKFESDRTGHDFEHIMRVFRTAKHLQKKEGGDTLIIELAALFHDYPDEKLTTDPALAKAELSDWMKKSGLDPDTIKKIMRAVESVSYKQGENPVLAETLEEKIVQDADRLDALGAIGIIRAFTYGGAKARQALDYHLENPNTTLAHFFDKLLLLKDKMHTKTAIKAAEKRHSYMLKFLSELQDEKVIKNK